MEDRRGSSGGWIGRCVSSSVSARPRVHAWCVSAIAVHKALLCWFRSGVLVPLAM